MQSGTVRRGIRVAGKTAIAEPAEEGGSAKARKPRAGSAAPRRGWLVVGTLSAQPRVLLQLREPGPLRRVYREQTTEKFLRRWREAFRHRELALVDLPHEFSVRWRPERKQSLK